MPVSSRESQFWEETAKMDDLDFTHQELGPAFPLVLAELLQTIEDEEEGNRKENPQTTVVSHSTAMSESPLPRLIGASEPGMMVHQRGFLGEY
jgi:hypothetical protein